MENDPLLIKDHSNKFLYLNRNRRGRPNNYNIVRFGTPPKSIVSQKLHEEKQSSHKGTQKVDFTDNSFNNYSKKRCSVKDYIVEREYIYLKEYNTLLDKPENEVNESDQNLNDANLNEPKNQIICNSCTYSCQYVEQLKEHRKVHKKKILYACDFKNCSYNTNISSNLTKHKRKHTNEKPYLCELCSFKSSFISSLKAHRRIHTSERPFCCEHCGYRCNSSSNLKKHLGHRHPSIMSK